MVSEDVSNAAGARKTLTAFPAKCRHLLFWLRTKTALSNIVV